MFHYWKCWNSQSLEKSWGNDRKFRNSHKSRGEVHIRLEKVYFGLQFWGCCEDQLPDNISLGSTREGMTGTVVILEAEITSFSRQVPFAVGYLSTVV